MDSTKLLISLLKIIEDLEGSSTPIIGNLVGVSCLIVGNLEAAPAPIPHPQPYATPMEEQSQIRLYPISLYSTDNRILIKIDF